MGLRPTGCSSMLHRRQIVHLVNRFYHTLESHKAHRWISDPHLTMTFYLCWYSMLFILKGAVISMMCFKSLCNAVSYYVRFLGGQTDTQCNEIFWTNSHSGGTRSCFDFIYPIADVILVIGLYLSALPVWENANIFLILVPTSPFHCL